MEAKEHLLKIRGKISEFMLQNRSIDKLMREKVDDYILIDELPIGIRIGEKTIFVGNFTLENQHVFFREYPKILANMGAQCVNFDLLGNANGDLYKNVVLHKRLYKDLCKLIHKTIVAQQWYYNNKEKVSLSYFKKYMTMEKLIQFCWFIYLYNFDAVKKNLALTMRMMDVNEASGTYMYGWLVNLAGLTGKFLLSQLINSDLSSSDSVISAEEMKSTGKK